MTLLEPLGQCVGQCIDVELQPDCQRGLRAHTRTDPAEALALNCLMQFDRIAPERLVPESIEAKDVSALRERALRMIVDLSVESRQLLFVVVIVCHRTARAGEG